MRLSYCLVVPVISFFLSGVNAFNNLASRDPTDVCAAVDAELKVGSDTPGLGFPVGVIGKSDFRPRLPSWTYYMSSRLLHMYIDTTFIYPDKCCGQGCCCVSWPVQCHC